MARGHVRQRFHACDAGCTLSASTWYHEGHFVGQGWRVDWLGLPLWGHCASGPPQSTLTGPDTVDEAFCVVKQIGCHAYCVDL